MFLQKYPTTTGVYRRNTRVGPDLGKNTGTFCIQTADWKTFSDQIWDLPPFFGAFLIKTAHIGHVVGGSIRVLYALFWSKMLQIRGVSLIFGPKKSFSRQPGYKMYQDSSPPPLETCTTYTCVCQVMLTCKPFLFNSEMKFFWILFCIHYKQN